MENINYLKIQNDMLMAAYNEIASILIKNVSGKKFNDMKAVDILNQIATVINVTDRSLQSLITKENKDDSKL